VAELGYAALFIGTLLEGETIVFLAGFAAKVPRVQALLRRWDVLALLLIRFLWGPRTVAPLVIGSSGVAPWRLVVFDFVGATLWAFVLAGLGYFAGQAAQYWVARLELSVVLALMALALAAGTVWNILRARQPR
jgi:membrane protein DedA with SNARE-associated domain